MNLDRHFLCWALKTVMVRGAGSLAALVAIGLLAAGLGGCGASFDSPSLLSKLRLLALQAEPVNPAEGGTTTHHPAHLQPLRRRA